MPLQGALALSLAPRCEPTVPPLPATAAPHCRTRPTLARRLATRVPQPLHPSPVQSRALCRRQPPPLYMQQATAVAQPTPPAHQGSEACHAPERNNTRTRAKRLIAPRREGADVPVAFWFGAPTNQTDQQVAARSRRTPTRSASFKPVPIPRTRIASHRDRVRGPELGERRFESRSLSPLPVPRVGAPRAQTRRVLRRTRLKVVATLAPPLPTSHPMWMAAAVHGALSTRGPTCWREERDKNKRRTSTREDVVLSNA